MTYIRLTTWILISVVASFSVASASDSAADPKKAIEQSQITAAGAHPFVLRANVLEATNPSNASYKAEIEEHWFGPNKWRRTVKSAAWSQTLIVNGDKTSEQITGDYYPNWLRAIVTAIFDPGDPLQGLDMSRSTDNPMIGGKQVCRRFTFMAGTAPVSNKVFSVFCFEDGLLSSVLMPGYDASYSNYKKFGSKHVARKIREYIESGTEVEASIDELKELDSPVESEFAILQPNVPVQTVHVSEETLRSLAVSAPDVAWPTGHSGALTGTLSLYVCLDRSGSVREIYELNSSNPGMSDAARDQVMKWHFKSAVSQGVPVQVESILTFAFQAKP